MFELRVLSGLHRGAALPLVGDTWLVGAADEADLALYDPGVCAQHARLGREDGQWHLEPLQGALTDAHGERWLARQPLPVDAPFALAGVWLCLAAAEQPWPDDATLDEAARGAAGQAAPKASARPSWPKRALSAVVVVTLASSAWALSNRPEQALAPPEPAPPLSQAKVPAASPAQARQALERMLVERELADTVRVEAQGDELALVGELPRQRLALVARLVQRFAERYGTGVGVVDRVRERQSQLPFEIVQIVGGKHGHVVTSTGRRLFVGDQVDGLRLTAIDSDRVSFEGDQHYEVSW